MRDIHLRSLTPADAASLSQLLTEDSHYSRFFIPFENPTPPFLAELLSQVQEDRYWGIFAGDRLAGFCMLRGLDAGYTRPAFGVYTGADYAGMGLATLALRWCMSYCRLNNFPAMMLKVHPDNRAARHIYEQNGFTLLGSDPKNGHHIMEKRWVES